MGKKVLITFLTAWVLTAGALFQGAAPAGAGESPGEGGQPLPGLRVENEHLDAGTVVEGDPLHFSFKLANTGKGALVIKGARTRCSCTKVSHDGGILPGAAALLKVAFDTRGQAGDQVKAILLETNDPARPEIELTVAVRILPAVRVVPDRIFFNGPAGQAMTARVTLYPPDAGPFTVEILERHLPPHIQAELLEKDPETGAYEVLFSSDGKVPGTSRGRLVLKTSVPYKPRLILPVLSRIMPGLAHFPDTLDFGRISLAKIRQGNRPDPVRTLNLKAGNGIPPKISALSLDPERFRTAVIPLPDLGVTRIRVTALAEKFTAGDARADMTLALEVGDSLTVPVRISFF